MPAFPGAVAQLLVNRATRLGLTLVRQRFARWKRCGPVWWARSIWKAHEEEGREGVIYSAQYRYNVTYHIGWYSWVRRAIRNDKSLEGSDVHLEYDSQRTRRGSAEESGAAPNVGGRV